MFCHKCKADVHPAQIMATRAAGEGSVANGFYNQCPRCQSPMPDFDVQEPAAARVSSLPVGGSERQKSNESHVRRGSMIDMAKSELAEADREIASLHARIAETKTEIALKKVHRAGLLRVVSAYEKASRSSASLAAASPSDDTLAN